VRVTAEGVEALDHEAALLRLGCKHAQGFLYAPALPLDELTATIISRTPGHSAFVARPQSAAVMESA
jgi:EAL domain-containing protein (putative c-di-GMP-specific phosphodiesterase class I)